MYSHLRLSMRYHSRVTPSSAVETVSRRRAASLCGFSYYSTSPAIAAPDIVVDPKIAPFTFDILHLVGS